MLFGANNICLMVSLAEIEGMEQSLWATSSPESQGGFCVFKGKIYMYQRSVCVWFFGAFFGGGCFLLFLLFCLLEGEEPSSVG